jgi:hypothetical protein
VPGAFKDYLCGQQHEITILKKSLPCQEELSTGQLPSSDRGTPDKQTVMGQVFEEMQKPGAGLFIRILPGLQEVVE